MESQVREITQDKLLVGIKDGAAALGIGITLMRELIAAGAVQSVHVGGRHLILTSSLRDYVRGLQEEAHKDGYAHEDYVLSLQEDSRHEEN
jgi:hypothetical protein